MDTADQKKTDIDTYKEIVDKINLNHKETASKFRKIAAALVFVPPVVLVTGFHAFGGMPLTPGYVAAVTATCWALLHGDMFSEPFDGNDSFKKYLTDSAKEVFDRGDIGKVDASSINNMKNSFKEMLSSKTEKTVKKPSIIQKAMKSYKDIMDKIRYHHSVGLDKTTFTHKSSGRTSERDQDNIEKMASAMTDLRNAFGVASETGNKMTVFGAKKMEASIEACIKECVVDLRRDGNHAAIFSNLANQLDVISGYGYNMAEKGGLSFSETAKHVQTIIECATALGADESTMYHAWNQSQNRMGKDNEENDIMSA